MRPIVTETIARTPAGSGRGFGGGAGARPPTASSHARYLRELAPFHLIEAVLPRLCGAMAGPALGGVLQRRAPDGRGGGARPAGFGRGPYGASDRGRCGHGPVRQPPYPAGAHRRDAAKGFSTASSSSNSTSAMSIEMREHAGETKRQGLPRQRDRVQPAAGAAAPDPAGGKRLLVSRPGRGAKADRRPHGAGGPARGCARSRSGS